MEALKLTIGTAVLIGIWFASRHPSLMASWYQAWKKPDSEGNGVGTRRWMVTGAIFAVILSAFWFLLIEFNAVAFVSMTVLIGGYLALMGWFSARRRQARKPSDPDIRREL
jgi:hypothetical protein